MSAVDVVLMRTNLAVKRVLSWSPVAPCVAALSAASSSGMPWRGCHCSTVCLFLLVAMKPVYSGF